MNKNSAAECRAGCGACCIAPSISSPMPLMPDGKPAGVRCAHLTEANLCNIFGRAERPSVCSSLMPSAEMCCRTREEALVFLAKLEYLTAGRSQ